MKKLTKIWLEKIQKNEQLEITDLYPFSKIKLKHSIRRHKKFYKNYERYVSQKVLEAYWSCLISSPLVNSFRKSIELDLKVISAEEGIPKGLLIYPNINDLT
jgi:hypothetical protein